jgi:AraC family ethanolamine operon transcriptional activator
MDHIAAGRRRHPSDTIARQQIVERAEAYARAHMDGSIRLSQLCRVVGLSERGLRNAFYRVRGMSPKRSIRAERLQRVRGALTAAGSQPGTVSDVATEYGFYELGRFAARYKEAFGEAPSETLRGGARRSSAESGNTKGHDDVRR